MFAGNTVAEVTFGNGAAFGDDSVCSVVSSDGSPSTALSLCKVEA